MKSLVLVISLLLTFGTQLHARTLNCVVSNDGIAEKLLQAEISLDDKPLKSGTSKITQTKSDVTTSINGVTGKLCLQMWAGWYNQVKNGAVKLNNVNDTFPSLNISASFYDGSFYGLDHCPEHPGPPSFVALFTNGTPTFNIYRSSKDTPAYTLAAYNGLELIDYPARKYQYAIRCQVND